MKIVYIYGLIDPRDNIIKYIGKTINIKNRYADHRNRLERASSKRKSWIQSLRTLNLYPILTIIEECNEETCDERERFWIKHYKDVGNDLKNMTDGGEKYSYKEVTPESRQRMSIAQKKRFQTEKSPFLRQDVKEKVKMYWKTHSFNNPNFIEGGIKTRFKAFPIVQLTLEGKFLKEWASSTNIVNSFNCDNSTINRTLNRKCNIYKQYRWMHKSKFIELKYKYEQYFIMNKNNLIEANEKNWSNQDVANFIHKFSKDFFKRIGPHYKHPEIDIWIYENVGKFKNNEDKSSYFSENKE